MPSSPQSASDGDRFDVIVIGAGPAGEVIAGRLAERSDKRLAIIEDDLVGGECAFYACMPSKALLRPQEALREVRRIPGAAEAFCSELDVDAVLRRRDDVIHRLDDSEQVPWLHDRGVELIRGHGRLDGERRVRVGERLLEAREAIVLAPGSKAVLPQIPGLAEANPWTNREATTASKVPPRLAILGGGAVGVEMAQAWSSLGSNVVLVEAEKQVLPGEEQIAGELVADALSELGVDLRLGARATRVRRDRDEIAIELEGSDVVGADELLVAVGRHPRTDDLGLDTVGLEPGKTIDVDGRMAVAGHPWLFAVGDVNGRALLTHMGKYQARLVADEIMGSCGSLRLDGRRSPRIVFTDPQVAAVGLTLDAAEAEGLSARAIDLPTGATAGASFYGRNAAGKSRFVVDTKREILLGATFVGAEVADFLQAATIAVVGEVPLQTLAHAVAPFPTRSELWLKFIEAYGL